MITRRAEEETSDEAIFRDKIVGCSKLKLQIFLPAIAHRIVTGASRDITALDMQQFSLLLRYDVTLDELFVSIAATTRAL